jgi:putative DNA primase/helicase
VKYEMKDDERKYEREIIVKALMQKHRFVTAINDILYVYDDGIYKAKGYPESIIRAYTEEALNEESARYDKNEIIDSIKSRSYVDWNFFDPTHNLDLICVANGVLNWKTGELIPHSPDYHFLNKIPVWYLTREEWDLLGCEDRTDKFMNEIMSNEDDVKRIYEFFGYCLYRNYPIHKAIMLIGLGANGKSTLLNLLKAFLGRENTINISLQDLCQNRFAKANLHGKLANYYADLSNKALYQTGAFKMLTGGDEIDAEHKFVQHRTKMKNYAKLIFSANLIPANNYDDTMAFWRRWIIITFPNVFNEQLGNVDKNIIDKLTTKEELSGLLLKSIEALKRLLKNQAFTKSQSSEQIRESYIMKSNSVQAFREKMLVENVESFEEKDIMFEAFKSFCEIYHLPIYDRNVFSRKLRSYINFRDCQKSIRGHRKTCYCGLELKSKVESETEQQTLTNEQIEETFR